MDALKSEIKDHLKHGQIILDEKLMEFGIKPQARVYRKLTTAYGLTNRFELFSKVGAGVLDLSDLSKMLKKNSKNKFVRYWNLQFSKITGIDSSDAFNDEDEISENEESADSESIDSDLNEQYQPANKSHIDKRKDYLLAENPLEKTLSYQVARCCKPIPGDKVIGFIDDNEEVIVHKNSCPEAIQLASRYGERIVKAKWSKHTVLSFSC